jgi:hypothetical protein
MIDRDDLTDLLSAAVAVSDALAVSVRAQQGPEAA